MFYFKQLYKNQFSSNFQHLFAIFILSLYPITFFLGTGILNLFIILIDLILLIEIFKNKKFYIFNNKIFISMLLLWFVLLINLFFSIDPINSLSRSLGFIRYIFFVLAIIYFFNIYNQKYQKIIITSWLIIFFVVNIDLIYEFIFGKNIFGFKSYMPGRLASFFNDELRIGHYYHAFCLIILCFILQKLNYKKLKKFKYFSNINIIILLSFFFIFISFIIGERSNFIKTFIMISLFIFLFEKQFIKRKIFIFLLLIGLIYSIISLNESYKSRFLKQLILPFIKNPISYVEKSSYIDHYKAGIQIFNENKFFGVGLKNYRKIVKDKKYVNPSIHPHQIHIELLSELGILGYLCFIIFFIYNFLNLKNNLIITQNYYNLSGLLFIISCLIPLLPSGSFFTSHAAALFWMNFAFMNFSNKIN